MTDRPSIASARRIAAAAVPVLSMAWATLGIQAADAAQHAAAAGWRVAKTIAAKNTELTCITAVAGWDAWAGGESPAQGPVIYQLTGGKWHSVLLLGPPGSFVNQISATSSSNVWASISNEPDVAHLTRSGWKLTSFANGTDDILLAGVLTFGAKNTWVFAYDFTTKSQYSLHFTGSAWHQAPLPSLVDASSSTGMVSASSASNIWALTQSPGGVPEAMRYNGTKWQVFKLPAHLAPSGETAYTKQILALSKSNVWITVLTSAGTGHNGPVVLLHWNGHAWAKVTGKLPAGALTGAISSDGHGGLWLGGETPAGFPRLFHYSGGTWSTSKVPPDSLGKPTIAALTVVPGTHSVLGVADLGLNFGGDNGAEIIRYNP